MENAYINGYCESQCKPQYPPAHIYLFNTNFIENKRIARIDYAGGGVVAPSGKYLVFMKALVKGQLVKDLINLKIESEI